MNRAIQIEKIKSGLLWDIFVIGGGATGLGIAVDAASRGYNVALAEKTDFAKGTSGRSTKLVHGGVRYLAQGNVKLVMEALKERAILLKNAPHITKIQTFIVPAYSWLDMFFYGVGLSVYNLLAGKHKLEGVKWLSANATINQLPQLNETGLKGGISYCDGQFDDARLAINLAQTATDHGASVVNHVEVVNLIVEGKKIAGVVLKDEVSGESFSVMAKVVINATGVFADQIMSLEDKSSRKMISPSQGIHLVVDKQFFTGNSALMVPKTSDGRVLFIVPWHHQLVIGTTDTKVNNISEEPVALEEEINFLLSHFNKFSTKPIALKDVKSAFAGLRPLIKSSNISATSLLSREHTIVISAGGLLTIAGGKWTTYRKMAKDAIQNAIFIGKLEKRECVTENLEIHGYAKEVSVQDVYAAYGSDKVFLMALIEENPVLSEKIHPNYPYTKVQIVWAVKEEMAISLEDILSRRVRLLIEDARAAVEAAPLVAETMANILGKNQDWINLECEQFEKIASTYILNA
jgi:glycerol-3-phosphate dehydrogenase